MKRNEMMMGAGGEMEQASRIRMGNLGSWKRDSFDEISFPFYCDHVVDALHCHYNCLHVMTS